MQIVANHLPLRTIGTKDAAHSKRVERIDRVCGLLANLFCTVVFSWLLIWLGREMWRELMG